MSTVALRQQVHSANDAHAKLRDVEEEAEEKVPEREAADVVVFNAAVQLECTGDQERDKQASKYVNKL